MCIIISDISVKIVECCKTCFILCMEETRAKLKADLKSHRSVKVNKTAKILIKGKPFLSFLQCGFWVVAFINNNDVCDCDQTVIDILIFVVSLCRCFRYSYFGKYCPRCSFFSGQGAFLGSLKKNNQSMSPDCNSDSMLWTRGQFSPLCFGCCVT